MRNLIALALSFTIGFAAFAASPTRPRELPFKIVSASVDTFDPPQRTRQGRYTQALVLQLEVKRDDWTGLPPDIAPFLYIGNHELRPFANVLDGKRVVYTFHDPDWQQLQGGELMVLTTRHGDPILHPETYKGYPRYDPRLITKK